MVGKSKLTIKAARLDRLCGELFSAVRVSEDEISATACSDDAYGRVRMRIAEAGARHRERRSTYHRLERAIISLLGVPRLVVLSSAAAILVALVLGLSALLTGPSVPETGQLQSSMQATVPSQEEKSETVSGGSSGRSTKTDSPSKRLTAQRKRARFESPASEVTTDFLPLTYVDDLSAQQSGHIVRMKVPRSALIAFGVPMNMERAGELITADVMIGDDGLARAIRFVQ